MENTYVILFYKYKITSGKFPKIPTNSSSYSGILKVNIHQEFANAVEMKSNIYLRSVYVAQVGSSVLNNQLSVWRQTQALNT